MHNLFDSISLADLLVTHEELQDLFERFTLIDAMLVTPYNNISQAKATQTFKCLVISYSYGNTLRYQFLGERWCCGITQ